MVQFPLVDFVPDTKGTTLKELTKKHDGFENLWQK